MWRQVPTPKKAAFLAAYAATCTVTKAAEAAKIHRATHYDWLRTDPEYKAQFEQTQVQVVQALEDEAIRRAYHGTRRPVTVAGKRELVTDYSDTLLIFLLKGARPQKYRDNVHVDGSLAVGAIEQAIVRGRERAAKG
jgi:hypothetical protein